MTASPPQPGADRLAHVNIAPQERFKPQVREVPLHQSTSIRPKACAF